MDSPTKDLSIVIPAYNSEKTIATLVGLLHAQFNGKKTIEVIIVDDGSSESDLRNLPSARERELFRQSFLFSEILARQVPCSRASGKSRAKSAY